MEAENLKDWTILQNLDTSNVRKVFVFGETALILRNNGIMCGIGRNNRYILAYFAKSSSIGDLKEICAPSKIKDFTTNGEHVLAIGEEGFLYSWGSNEHGQLGRDGYEWSVLPVLKVFAVSIKEAACGTGFSCVLTEDGRVFEWGIYGFNQLVLESGNELKELDEGGENDEIVSIIGTKHYPMILTKSGKVFIPPFQRGSNKCDSLHVEKIYALQGSLKNKKIIQLLSCRNYVFALTSGGEVHQWALLPIYACSCREQPEPKHLAGNMGRVIKLWASSSHDVLVAANSVGNLYSIIWSGSSSTITNISGAKAMSGIDEIFGAATFTVPTQDSSSSHPFSFAANRTSRRRLQGSSPAVQPTFTSPKQNSSIFFPSPGEKSLFGTGISSEATALAGTSATNSPATSADKVNVDNQIKSFEELRIDHNGDKGRADDVAASASATTYSSATAASGILLSISPVNFSSPGRYFAKLGILVDGPVYDGTSFDMKVEENDEILNEWKRRFAVAFNNKERCDVAFVVGDGIIYAHRAILSIQSPYLNAILDNEWKEKSDVNQITIENYSYPTYLRFMRFLYTGQLEISSFEGNIELLQLAHEYEEKPLLNTCKTLVIQGLTVVNAYSTYRIAHLLGLEDMREACKSIIGNNLQDFILGEEMAKEDDDLLRFVRDMVCSQNIVGQEKENEGK